MTDYYELQSDKAEEVVYSVAKSLSWKIDEPQEQADSEVAKLVPEMRSEKKSDATTAPQPQETEPTGGNYIHRRVKYSVGDIIQFGKYSQTENGEVKPIDWQVLDVRGGGTLIISKYTLDYRQYNSTDSGVTWETCSLHQWLNGEFFYAAFGSQEERNIIIDSILKYPGGHSKDKIFLLSIPGVNKYFKSDDARKCTPTPWGCEHYYQVNPIIKMPKSKCNWWLRSPIVVSRTAPCINEDGRDIADKFFCFPVAWDSVAVRPALWINLESQIF